MKKLIGIILVCGLIISMAACGSSPLSKSSKVSETSQSESSAAEPTVVPSEKPFDLKAYKDSVSIWKKTVMDQSLLLANMGSYIVNYWTSMENLNGTMDFDEVVTKSFDWLVGEKPEYTRDFIETTDKDIRKQYKELLNSNVSGSEDEKIQEKIDEMFETYNSFYSLVTSPSGSINDFTDSFGEYTDNLQDTESMIDVFITDESD